VCSVQLGNNLLQRGLSLLKFALQHNKPQHGHVNSTGKHTLSIDQALHWSKMDDYWSCTTGPHTMHLHWPSCWAACLIMEVGWNHQAANDVAELPQKVLPTEAAFNCTLFVNNSSQQPSGRQCGEGRQRIKTGPAASPATRCAAQHPHIATTLIIKGDNVHA